MKSASNEVAIRRELADDLAVQIDHRDPFEIGEQEPIVGVDIDLAKLVTRPLGKRGQEELASLVAKVAALTPVERDDTQTSASHSRYSGYGVAAT